VVKPAIGACNTGGLTTSGPILSGFGGKLMLVLDDLLMPAGTPHAEAVRGPGITTVTAPTARLLNWGLGLPRLP
jgi:hypothetical protein